MTQDIGELAECIQTSLFFTNINNSSYADTSRSKHNDSPGKSGSARKTPKRDYASDKLYQFENTSTTKILPDNTGYNVDALVEFYESPFFKFTDNFTPDIEKNSDTISLLEKFTGEAFPDDCVTDIGKYTTKVNEVIKQVRENSRVLAHLGAKVILLGPGEKNADYIKNLRLSSLSDPKIYTVDKSRSSAIALFEKHKGKCKEYSPFIGRLISIYNEQEKLHSELQYKERQAEQLKNSETKAQYIKERDKNEEKIIRSKPFNQASVLNDFYFSR